MIELTTGVVFLMSSLYGAGQHGYTGDTVATDSNETEVKVEAVEKSSFTDNQQKVQAYLQKEFADTPILVDIARCESEFRQFDNTGNIVHGRVNKDDIGVMQINLHYHADTAVKMGIDLYTLEGNVAFGKYLYSKYGSNAWSASKPCWSSAELARK